MVMQGIDIASYQTGIDLGAVPADFVIIKATQGVSYTNPDCVRAYENAKAHGKCIGVYHYITGVGAEAEAKFFVDSIRNWVGGVMICLDWESGDNAAWGNQAYLEQVVAAVIRLTGVKPVIYAQSSVYPLISAVSKKFDCGLWVAQYANMNPTGYQDAPWNEGSYQCVMRQYSSAGSLNGWNGLLDLDKFYGDKAMWNRYAGAAGVSAQNNEEEEMISQEDIQKIAQAVWLQKLPNNAVARDCIAPAVQNAFWIRDTFAANVLAQIAKLQATVDAYKTALDMIGKGQGINGDQIEKTVQQSVQEALKDMKITLATEQDQEA